MSKMSKSSRSTSRRLLSPGRKKAERQNEEKSSLDHIQHAGDAELFYNSSIRFFSS